MASNSIDIIFNAIDNSSRGTTSVVQNLRNMQGAARLVFGAFDDAWRGLDRLSKDYETWASKSGDPKAVEEAQALRDAFNEVNESVASIKFTLLEIVAGPLAEFLNGLSAGIAGFGELATYEKNMSEIEAIAARMREEQGIGAGAAYGPGSQLGQSLKDEAEIMEAARLEWAKLQEEEAAAAAAAAKALPPPEKAKTTEAAMDALSETLATVTPESVEQMQALMDAVTSLDTGNLDEAHKMIMELVKLDGKTITIHVEYTEAPQPPSSNNDNAGASSGNSYSFYGTSFNDVLADLRA